MLNTVTEMTIFFIQKLDQACNFFYTVTAYLQFSIERDNLCIKRTLFDNLKNKV